MIIGLLFMNSYYCDYIFEYSTYDDNLDDGDIVKSCDSQTNRKLGRTTIYVISKMPERVFPDLEKVR